MVTLFILLLVVTLLLLILTVCGIGIIFPFLWAIILIADIVIGFMLFGKIIKKIFGKKGGTK